MTVSVKRWTREQYATAVNAGVFHGERVELINGEILAMSPMDARHATSVGLTSRLVGRIIDESQFHVRSQMPFAATDIDEPEPDVAIVKGQIRDFANDHPATAEVIFEIANSSLRRPADENPPNPNPSQANNGDFAETPVGKDSSADRLTYDTTTKMEKYATCGVETYFVVDLVNCRVIRFSGSNGTTYTSRDEYASDSSFVLLDQLVEVNDLLP